ncbi:MAG TPA: pseudouridine-5'-phosphate glycosidase, partial [Candidatus Limnocylindria bacterium]|nr:pseudouridine-5'-phosphate glycosidase [Candidatus Limnocylindria bacterium]
IDRRVAETEVARAVDAAEKAGVRGAVLTPYLLGALGEATSGRSLASNVSLLRQNARVAAQIALALAV